MNGDSEQTGGRNILKIMSDYIFFYKNQVYKKHEAQIRQRLRNN